MAPPMILGQYRPRQSFLHRLDARAKIIPVSLVLVFALFSSSSMFYTSCLVCLISGLLVSGVGPVDLLRNLRPILILGLITVLYHLIFGDRSGPVLFEIAGWRITEQAADRALFFSLRLLLFVSVAFVVTLTTSPSELAESLASLSAPLSRIGVPVRQLAMIVFIAIRFIPILYNEFQTIRNAQLVRGVRLTGSFVTRLKRSSAIVVPVFMAAIQRADELALAMEARGYDGQRRRTTYTRATFGRPEILFCLASITALTALFVVFL